MYKIIKTINIKTSQYFYGIIQSNTLAFDKQIGDGVVIDNPMSYQFSKTKFQQNVKEFGISNFRTEVQDFGNYFDDIFEKFCKYLTPKKVAQAECLNNVYPIKLNHCYLYDFNGKYLVDNAYPTCDSSIIINGLTENGCYHSLWLENNFSKAKKMYIQNRSVYKYDINGNLLASYNSQVEAEKANKYSNITKSIKFKCPCKNGFFWSLQKLPKLSWKTKKYVQRYDINGNYIRGWKFKKQCYRDVDLNVWKSFNTNKPYTDGFVYVYN